MILGSSHLTIVKDSTNTLYIPKKFLNHIDSSNVKWLKFGSKKVRCEIENASGDSVGISNNIFSKLQIPFEQQIHLSLQNNAIYIGPLVGIFTAGFTGSHLRPVGERSLLFAKYLSAGNYAGVIPFIFGIKQIDWKRNMINGYFFTEDGWKIKEVPFPNVIYNRLPNRKTENFPPIKTVMQRFTEENIPSFNTGFFDKWTIHKMVLQHNRLKKHVPETLISPGFLEIKRMLQQYGECFLKPVNGSLGYGIFHIILKENEYFCRFRSEHQNHLRKFTSLEKLMKIQFKDINLKDYLCQQGIDLIKHQGLPLDFRVHTNKNEKGQWEMTALAAKVAGNGSITTHLRTGGTIKILEEIDIPFGSHEKLYNWLEQYVLSLSRFIAEKTNGHIGEIGFDIGIDQKGSIWLFEANSKPGRSIFSHPALKKNEIKTRSLPFSYSVYLMDKSAQSIEQTRVNKGENISSKKITKMDS
jgi:hypothetical protein